MIRCLKSHDEPSTIDCPLPNRLQARRRRHGHRVPRYLPEAFAADAARMARFQREAQLLAALNHPNIATILGIEQGAIVMELVPGEDLKGPCLWKPRSPMPSNWPRP